MSNKKIDIELENVQETLFLPLWGRMIESQKEDPLIVDKAAIEIINRINYDFSRISNNITEISRLGWVARSLTFDKIIRNYISKYPKGTIVDIGCGLDTTYDRIDNKQLTWYDLDLPDVIKLRRKFIKEDTRREFISSSFLEDKWLDQLRLKENIFFISAGVFYYFKEFQIREFINKIIEIYPKCEIAFDATSNIKMANKIVLKRTGVGEKSLLKWELKNANKLESWNLKLKLLDCYPMFRILDKKKLSFKTRIQVFISDLMKLQYVVHLKNKEEEY